MKAMKKFGKKETGEFRDFALASEYAEFVMKDTKILYHHDLVHMATNAYLRGLAKGRRDAALVAKKNSRRKSRR